MEVAIYTKQDLGLEDCNNKFHFYRRGGCQFGFLKEVIINVLKALGGGTSSAISTYITISVVQLRALWVVDTKNYFLYGLAPVTSMVWRA